MHTDVEELHKWHVEKCEAHPCFRRVPDEEALAQDPGVRTMLQDTEESKKVARLGGNKHFAVYERIADWNGAEDQQATAGSSSAGCSTATVAGTGGDIKFNSHIMKLWEE